MIYDYLFVLHCTTNPAFWLQEPNKNDDDRFNVSVQTSKLRPNSFTGYFKTANIQPRLLF